MDENVRKDLLDEVNKLIELGSASATDVLNTLAKLLREFEPTVFSG